MNEQEYTEFTKPHRRFLKQINLDLDNYIEDIGIFEIFSKESRVKTFKSVLSKSINMKIPINEIDDIAGVRLVVATRNVVEQITSFFRRRSEILKDINILKEKKIQRNDTGYRSTHLVCEFIGGYLRSPKPGKFEVQIPTIFEHSFNFLSHSLLYKTRSIHNPKWEKDFISTSTKLNELDELVGKLHLSAYRESVFDSSTQILSPLLYQRILFEQFNEECEITDASDAVIYYRNIGINTIGDLRKFFEDEKIKSLWDEFHGKMPVEISKSFFWSIFGTRITAARSILILLASAKKAG